MATDWQGRCGALVGLILPLRSFTQGEFENMGDAAWGELLSQVRQAVKTDARLELAQQSLEQRKAKAEAARAKLSKDELAALGL